MKLYDNDSFRETFMKRVYELLADDPDNYRANEIIDLFDNAPEFNPPNEPLTLEQLREMDGEPVWVVVSQNWRESGIKSGWRLVKFHINDDRIRLYMFDTHFGASFFAEQDMGRSYWVYRRPPEGEEDQHGDHRL